MIIAEADGKITNLEKIYLKEVSNIFGFSDQDFERICSSKLNKYIDPYQTLGVSKDTPLEKIKMAANILNQWLDNNNDGNPDNDLVINALIKNNATLIIMLSSFIW